MLITQRTNQIDLFFPSELVLVIEVGTLWSQHLAGFIFTEKQENVFGRRQRFRDTGPRAVVLSPLCRMSAFRHGQKSNTKRNSFQTPCVLGAQLVSPLSIFYLSRSMALQQRASLHNCC